MIRQPCDACHLRRSVSVCCVANGTVYGRAIVVTLGSRVMSVLSSVPVDLESRPIGNSNNNESRKNIGVKYKLIPGKSG